MAKEKETVNHPSHYGGDVPTEHVKVALALGWDRNAFIYNCTKYLWRSGGNYVGRKNGADPLEDLKKARWYLDRAIAQLEEELVVVDTPKVEVQLRNAAEQRDSHPVHRDATCAELDCNVENNKHSPYCVHFGEPVPYSER